METIFWFLSKFLWAVVSPDVLLFLILIVGSLLLFTQKKTLGAWLVSSVTIFVLSANIFPIGDLIIIPLEERFPQPTLPERIDGIIVLGGSEDTYISVNRGQPTVDDSAERLFKFIHFARIYPNAKLVFAGGAGALGSKDTHSDTAREIFEQSGLDINRVIFESRSKNTYQNVVFSFALVKPQMGENWVLVTSAFHIPRSIGVFRKINWKVIPYPVDYRTAGLQNLAGGYNGFTELTDLTYGVREWLGLLAYWITGKTNNLFPRPLHLIFVQRLGARINAKHSCVTVLGGTHTTLWCSPSSEYGLIDLLFTGSGQYWPIQTIIYFVWLSMVSGRGSE